MINRNRRGHSYCDVRGEILGSSQDELLRKHLPRMFSLVRLRQLMKSGLCFIEWLLLQFINRDVLL